ncbi:hypothetical protein SUGI_0299450 [Cryptomeria japonica]|nr:hypothetical protein SUGI_0299450 [Cryptomeria japonica]
MGACIIRDGAGRKRRWNGEQPPTLSTVDPTFDALGEADDEAVYVEWEGVPSIDRMNTHLIFRPNCL